MPAPGPTFFREDDGPMMFQFVIDGGSIIGPRVATKLDMANHTGAYMAFVSLEAAADAEVAPEAPVIAANRPEPEPIGDVLGPDTDPLDAKTDKALREFIRARTGRWPPPKCTRETLLRKARE